MFCFMISYNVSSVWQNQNMLEVSSSTATSAFRKVKFKDFNQSISYSLQIMISLETSPQPEVTKLLQGNQTCHTKQKM